MEGGKTRGEYSGVGGGKNGSMSIELQDSKVQWEHKDRQRDLVHGLNNYECITYD